MAAIPPATSSPVGHAPVRMVFSDLDGTFLTRQKTIPQRNLDALTRLAERGLAFVPCTGRSASSVPPELLRHPASRYVVADNGVIVAELPSGRVLNAWYMGKERTLALYEEVKDLDITFDVFMDGKILCEEVRYDRIPLMVHPEADLRFSLSSRTRTDLTVPQMLERARHVERVTVYFHRPSDRAEVIRCVEGTPGLTWTTSVPYDIEIMDAHASKGAALRWLCGYLGIATGDVVAFGDGENDVPMIKAAGDGVAMANAAPSIRAVADHVAPSCDEAGVARYLEGLGL